MKLVRKNNISDKVTFTGWVKDILPYLDSSEIFVLSSKREGFGYSLLEAMARGLPVVSTDTPFGPDEILENGKYGILVEMNNIPQMKNALKSLIINSNYYDHFGQQSIKRAHYFRSLNTVDQYKNIIDKLVE